MSEQAMTVSVDSDGIALVTIDLKGQSMNVWNEALMTEFAAFVEHFCKDDAIKGAVITTSKPSGFLAGTDLRMLGGGGVSAGASSPKEVFERLFNLNVDAEEARDVWQVGEKIDERRGVCKAGRRRDQWTCARRRA